ncbi:unnamed protein product [Oreochromis niloticus]|nr:unnamed protein product [Mustela putorius furo]
MTATPRCPFVYSRDQLLGLRQHSHASVQHEIPAVIKRNYHGCRARKTRRLRRKRFRPALPSVMTGNVRSLVNKMEVTRTEKVFRECSVICFTERWLHKNIPDQVVDINVFMCVRVDRDPGSSKKKRGGGLALYVNNRWCSPSHVKVRMAVCNKHIELLAVGLRPYCLPQEFSLAIIIIVYIAPDANAAQAYDVISSATADLLNRSPSAFVAITGDFNHTNLSTVLPTFKQYVDCKTRDNKTLDLFYANATESYTSSPLPPLGRADHNLVYIQPLYRPAVQRQPAATKMVTWTMESEETLL